MRKLHLDLPEGKHPRYLKIAEALREKIRSQKLSPGERLPSTRVLASSLGVHRQTVIQAFNELLAEGWISSQRRRFYEVSARLPSEFFSSRPFENTNMSSRRIHWRTPRAVDEQVELSGPPVKYPFHTGGADLRNFPLAEFKSHWISGLKSARSKIMSPGNPAGHPRFLDALSTYLRRARSLTDRRLIVTHGSQEAIYLAAQLLLKPGDRIAVESPGYAPAWAAFRSAGATLVPLRVDSHGLDPDDLAKKLQGPKGRSIRAIYVTPLHQFPTTVTLPMDRRLRLYSLAARYGVPILEDDYDHEYHYRSQPLAPLASQDPAQAVIYLSGFSKVLFPSARLGFMAVPEVLEGKLIALKRITTRENDVFFQDAIARWIEEGGFERHLRKMRRIYQERRDSMSAALEDAKEAGAKISWKAPDGGMAMWVKTELASDDVLRKAKARGVYVLPESALRMDGKASFGLRLGFASQAPLEIQRGIAELARALLD